MAGFKWVGTESGADPTGNTKRFNVAASHSGVLGPGDLVLITGDGTAVTGISEVDIGTANSANTGVIQWVEPSLAGESLSTTHLAASTAGTVMVNVDPFALYEADVTGTMVVANVGLNCPAVVTAGTVTDSIFVSNMGVNFTGVATTSTLPFQIVQLLDNSSGTFGGRALVRVNESTSKLGSTGIS
jgi:hypothetical protein